MSDLHNVKAIAQGIAALFTPFVEVVLHDLETNQIAAIFNAFSQRKIGDPSNLDITGEFLDVFPPYTKLGPQGEKIKSVSITLRDDAGEPLGLMCINVEITKWDQVRSILEAFIAPSAPQHPTLFKDDWQEKIHRFLEQKRIQKERLTKKEKKELIHELNRAGAFRGKHAPQIVASLLNLSRATVYNYLAEYEAPPL